MSTSEKESWSEEGQSLAEEFVHLESQVRPVEVALNHAQNTLQSLKQSLDRIDKKLQEHVGQNITVRAFRIGESRVVLVRHKERVRLVDLG